MKDCKRSINEYVIENYDQKKPFSSFLPGISGLKGIPIWAFYVNRGQAISGFGIEDKNSPILEFFPANASYQYVSTYGFRSFVRLNGGDIYEPFAPCEPSEWIQRKMIITSSDFSIEETNSEFGLRYKVTYFGLPNENMGALVRMVTIESLRGDFELELLDGLANIIPYGVSNSTYKEMSNLMKSWMEVYNLENQLPFFTVRASTGDEAEVSSVSKGHFYLSYREDGNLIQPIVDPKVIFGLNTSLNYPSAFKEIDFDHLENLKQVTVNKVPCAFSPVKTTLTEGKRLVIKTIIGHVDGLEVIQERVRDMIVFPYLDKKRREARNIIDAMLGDIETKTSMPILDAYIKQSYLDNFLRGGYPIMLKGDHKQFVYYVYSRKHGDPEREYNFFKLAPEYYSNGEGNFRDVNQNRRSDVYFNPTVGTYNIKLFMNLIQLDGYNPLIVQGSEFVLTEKELAKDIVHQHLLTHQEAMTILLEGKFTPGKIINYIQNNKVKLETDEESLMKLVFDHALQTEEARHGEGFWTDHFTYNLDLIEAYLDIFPDQLEAMLIKDNSYRFFDSTTRVLPRSQKHVLTKDGKVRQFGAAVKDLDKIKALSLDVNGVNWVKTSKGLIFETNLLVKLVSLCINKFSTLDPMGMGIEMEGNKPGWNDAMNGLPGLFGSGLGETFELLRIFHFLQGALPKLEHKTLELPVEIHGLMKDIQHTLNQNLNDFDYWNTVGTLRETYRESIRFG
ncbi:MAG: cellobiose phosphorylase, partial [Vallitaleaceae bacterium]|nr:cellobiose phosphorylase [Vallitaleaceae bacterium]